MTSDADASTAAAEFRSALPGLQERFIDAYNRRDLATVMDFYVADAYVVRPNGDVVRGRDAISAYHATRMQSGQRFMSMTTVALVPQTATAIEIADAVMELSSQRQTSRLVAIWKRQAAGDWKLAADIFV